MIDSNGQKQTADIKDHT